MCVQQYSAMQKPQLLRQPPQYPIASVDRALALMEMVRDFGRIRISVAAQLLDISPSTAHRLMAMLVYRGYVEQDASRRYVPGPAMGLTPTGLSWTAELRHRARTHMESLTERVGETSNLMVLSGDAVRFLSSIEPEDQAQPALEQALEQGQLPKVSEREGVALPAHKASGGKAILAELDPQHVEAIIEPTRAHRDDAWMTSLRNELAVVRTRGFATNIEGTEAGVSAIAVAIRDGKGQTIAGLSVSVPHTRFTAETRRHLVEALWRTKASLESDLQDLVVRR